MTASSSANDPDGMLVAEVISIGDEMTTGARVDTNSAWLSRRLADLGIRTLFHTTVADDFDAGAEAFRIAANRADVVVATGGLGPTRDDLTREMLAEVAGQPLEFREEVMQHIALMFSRRGRTMPERNRTQAMFPALSRVIDNPQGTAPGLDVTIDRSGKPPSRIFALPGVPAEMQQMFDVTVRDRLIQELGAGRRVIRQHVVKCFGVGESEMESRLGEMIARNRVPSVGITVSRATISLRITTDAGDNDEAQSQISRTRDEIHRLVPEYIFGEGEHYELQHALIDRLAEQRQTLTTIEFGAACPLTQWLAEAGDGSVYVGGVHANDWSFFGANSSRVASTSISDAAPPTSSTQPSENHPMMLKTFAEQTGADWVLAVDRYPQIPQTDQPLPAFPVTFRIWCTASEQLQTLSVELGGHPDIIFHRIGKAGLDFLRTQLT